MPLFSIIIPVYNVEQYLQDCLESVLAQEFSDCEVICVNDGSTDSSLEILQTYAEKYPQIKIINQENKGLSGARNRGLKEARGEYVFFLDSDDWIERNTLQVLSDSISEGKDMIVFNGRRYFEDGTQEDADDGIIENQLTGWEYYNKYALQPRKFHFVCVVLRLYRREFLLYNNLFFEQGIYHEDNLFTPMACYYAQSLKVIPDTLYVYRIRKGSITANINMKRLQDIITVANKLADFFISKTDIYKSVIYRDLATYYPNVLVLAKENLDKNEIELCYHAFNLIQYKVLAKNSWNIFFYFLMKIKSPLIYKYQKINKAFKFLKF